MSIFEFPVSFSLDKHPVVASRFSGYNKRKIHTKNQEGAMKKDPFFHCYEEMMMCGSYYIDSDMADEIQQVVREVDQRIRKTQFCCRCFCYHRQTWTYHTYRQECYKYLFNSSHVTYPFIFYYYLFRSFCRSSGSRSAACIISGRSTSCCCPFCSSGCSRSS